MSEFVTPLPRLLAETLDVALNELVRLDAGGKAKDKIDQLDAKPVALCLAGLEIVLVFASTDGHLSISAQPRAGFDSASVMTTITGTPSALLAMAIPNWSEQGSGVRIEGDAAAAQALEQLMRQLDPDWAQLFVERFGPVIGHQLYMGLKGALASGQHLGQTGFDQVSTFIKEESQWVVDRPRFGEFCERVDLLQEAIDRLAVNAKRRGLA